MHHDIHLQGHTFGLRPVSLADAQLIVDMRGSEHSRYMNRIDATVEAQRRFLSEYFRRPNEYYFVVERTRDRRPEGLTALTDLDERTRSAQWGRTVLRPLSIAAAEMALLVMTLAFETFDLLEVWGIALAENKRMLRYTESLGFERHQVVPVSVNGEIQEGIRSTLTRQQWLRFRPDVDRVAQLVGSI